MEIINQSIRIIDYENNEVYKRDTPEEFSEYVKQLITHIDSNASIREYKTRSVNTEVISCILDIIKNKEDIDFVTEKMETISKRLLLKEREAQSTVSKITNVQKGSLIQALLYDAELDQFNYLLAKVEHTDFVDDSDFSFKTGFSKDMKKLWKSCLFEMDDLNSSCFLAKVFLNNPAKYKEIGAKMPKGALLVGPPGTGKTLLAKAVAGEAGVPFFSISGSEFVEMFVGRGAAKVRDLFKQAREKAPCIVFIDEIDTIGKKRDGAGMNGNDEREQTLNQLLAEMDGFDGSKGVVLLAATNRPDSLDPALTRPGRFDRRIPVELPDLAGREAILKLHAKDIKCSNNIDFNVIARASAGASGAELANIINEGALLAVRDHRKTVVQKDLEEAIEIVIAGEQKKGAVISNRERMIVSYHEIGHALVAAKCKNTAPVHKITIIPRTKGALGYTMQVEENEQNLLSKEEAFQKIMVYTGGRCAEELIFNSITSGASNDIEQATKLARAMITRLGMSDEFGMTALETVNNQYLGGDTSLACSNETATKIDEATISLIKKAHDEAYQILEDNKMKLHELAKFLYERETITGEEFMYILNKPAEIPAQTNKD